MWSSIGALDLVSETLNTTLSCGWHLFVLYYTNILRVRIWDIT